MIKTLINAQRVQDLAYSAAQYTPIQMIAPSDIASAEQRYLIPVIGQSLYDVMMGGAYPTLLDDYVAPAIAEYVREVVDAPSAPASAKGVRRARTMMIRLSRHLDDNEQLYPEYCSSDNI